MENEEIKKITPSNADKQTAKQSFWELMRFALIAVAIVIPIRIFIAQPFIVSGSSMVPTFDSGQYLIVDELTYRLGEPQRGDVVVFRYPNDPSKFFIKRIIGLPNEIVEVKGENETIIINKEHPEGFKLDQPYVTNHSSDTAHVQLKSDEYFVMGDNRSASYDSRSWGPVQRHFLIGRAFIRLLPLTKTGILPGNYKSSY